MVQARNLTAAEIRLARTVYGSTLAEDRIYFTDLDLGGAVTLAGMNLDTGRFDYTINWVDGFRGVLNDPSLRSTFIHELCHTWQGENGAWPTFYMAQSIWAQLSSGVRDIWRKREWRGWGEHRSTAYPFSASDIGNNWGTFNVEQQASIVESWFMPERERVQRQGNVFRTFRDFGPGVYGGGRSLYDARFPYIRDVIRARNRSAGYRALTLPAGGDPEVKAIQDKLVALGYLDASRADGLLGRSRSATLDAVEAFQRRNGLRADRDLGGANSETRRKFALPVEQLARAL